ncbi:MAG: hypothetical protein HY899_11490 [Deltaproteobacteria bacterium]|nr:hypothetical protein [Deltaproteobacteria bacterium]
MRGAWLASWPIAFVLAVGPAGADDAAVKRAEMGVRLVPQIVALDQDLETKRTQDQHTRIALVYDRDESLARRLAAAMRAGTDGGAAAPRIDAVVVVAERIDDSQALPPAALFLVEPLPDHLFRVVQRFAIQRQRILFSAFRGDVERGATAGIDVGIRVRTYFNLQTLRESNVRINPQALSISRTHE